jgi:putative DNA primase/helicase
VSVVSKEPIFVWGDKVELEHIDWLWPNRYPLSMVSIMAGLGGVGKSTLCLYMAAQITTGRPWIDDPPGTKREPGDVIILSAEDLPGQLIIPRLIAMGADISRVCILKATKVTLDTGQTGIVGIESLAKSGDLDMLIEVIKQAPNPKMVVIDPYTSYMGTKTDSNDNILVRSFLRPLGDVAADHKVAVIGITHLNKKEDSSADFRILGSVGQQNTARMCWLVAQDPDAEDRRYMVWLKGNLAPRQTGLAYRIMNVPVTFKNRTSFYSCYNFEKEPVQLTASELLAPRPQKGGRPRKQTKASEWLESFLSEGPVDSKLIYEEGEALGYSESTLKRTKKSMGILAIPIRNKGNDLVLRWEWRLRS